MRRIRFILVGAVAGLVLATSAIGQSPVIVADNPPLTEETIGRFTEFFEWAFDVPRYARKPKEDEGRVKGLTQIPLIAQSGNEVLKIIQSLRGDYTLAPPTEVIVEWQSDVLASQNVVNRVYQELERQAKRFKGHDA